VTDGEQGQQEQQDQPGQVRNPQSAPSAPGVDADAVDWESLRAAARAAMARAYAPYSRYPVGAAALVDDGRVVSGCNVENASYGLTLCAECGLVSALHATGGGRLTAFTCCDGSGAALMPCGRCRQLLWEHGGPELLVESVSGIRRLAELLPDAFGPERL
jgi:cytidine deaminase